VKKTLVISSLVSGGAEKLLVRLATEWSRHGDEVRVITLRSPDSDVFTLPGQVRRISLDAGSARGHSLLHFAALLFRLRREIRAAEPDVVVSFMIKTNILTLLATMGTRIRVVATEHSVIDRTDISRRNSLLRRVTYRRASRVVVLTEAAKRALLRMLPGVEAVAIPNPLMEDAGGNEAGPVDLRRYFAPSDQGLRFLVGMGRLHPVKGFDLLLEAFAQVREAHPEWRLLIFGDGDERPRLETMIRESGAQDVVRLPGFLASPRAALASADLFAVPSRLEGFGNVIIDAMAAGVPVVAFDCPDGPREIISPGRDGILVPPENPSALAEAMQRLMESAEERGRLASAAAQSVRRYEMGRILDLWDRVLSAA
jgi:GalNAc-alpha-(1->4)-GalNAc-alpha-(1->3)-diNAcBac-PP-undecaprenol alpha-1,4-N-acetyl-D-galactosaminyltransferase